jgi:uncharacterized membrane protein YsdA (DUF1294 family)
MSALTPPLPILAYLAVINAAAFAAMAADKQWAIDGKPRVPERTLLTLALLGGSAGAVAAQQWLRHKTRKQPFRSVLWGIALTQAMAAAVILAPAS